MSLPFAALLQNARSIHLLRERCTSGALVFLVKYTAQSTASEITQSISIARASILGISVKRTQRNTNESWRTAIVVHGFDIIALDGGTLEEAHADFLTEYIAGTWTPPPPPTPQSPSETVTTWESQYMALPPPPPPAERA